MVLIREDKTHQLYSIMQTGRKQGMRTMNQSLGELYRSSTISFDEAMAHSLEPAELERVIRQS